MERLGASRIVLVTLSTLSTRCLVRSAPVRCHHHFTHTHTRARARTHTHTHTRTRTHAHTHTHSFTEWCTRCVGDLALVSPRGDGCTVHGTAAIRAQRADDLLVCARVCLRLSSRAACVNICDGTQPAAHIAAASSRRATASHRPCISSHSHLRGHSLIQPVALFPRAIWWHQALRPCRC
jgi:hypothetical protein